MQPHVRRFVERAVTFQRCPECDGTRLTKEALSSKIEGKNIAELCTMQITDLAEWVRGARRAVGRAAAQRACSTCSTRSTRSGSATSRSTGPPGTLSGGEAQRTKMIRHLGSSLTDVTYVFDEPTIGLHPHDIERMNTLLLQLRDKGNTVLVVEHKPETIAIADHVVDLGPGAGTERRRDLLRGHGRGAAGERHRHRPPPRRPRRAQGVGARGVRARSRSAAPRRTTCKKVDVDVPLGVLCVVTGVAGSGKSSLIHGSVAGRDGVVVVDQGAIKGSRRSNPATYTGLLEPIRKAFAKANGVKPALFSSNSEGACPTCNGAGRDLHRARRDGHRRVAVRGVRGARASRRPCWSTPSAARTSPRCWPCRSPRREAFFGDGEAKTPAAAQGPRPARGRRAGLSQPRPAADHAVRR